MHWILALIVANIAVFILEYIYRAVPGNFFTLLYLSTVPILLGQWALFDMFRNAPSLIIAGAAFSIVNVLLRVINSYLVGEAPGDLTYLGILFMILAIIIMKLDK